MAIVFGLDAKLYRNTGTYSSPTWNEIPNVRDLVLNLEAGESDVTTRGANGWRATLATLKDASIEFEMVWDSGDADFTAIRDAFLNRTSLDLAVLDGAADASGSQGLRASCMITKFARSEELAEALTVSVAAKPTYSSNAPVWMVVP